MSISPLITFKAGLCEVDSSSKPYKVKPQPTPGYIYLYSEDDLTHFCWRERSAPMDNPELDLVMVPTDGHFVPYEHKPSDGPTAKANGRIFVLKFSSSSQRHLFWLQSKPQHRDGNPSWFSPRDLKIGTIVNNILQGEEVDVARELAQAQQGGSGGGSGDGNGDDDEPMEDIEGTRRPHDHHGSGSGGAGPDATGGDVREEGESSREGGADGARAASSSAPDAAAAVRNFLESLKGGQGLGRQSQQQSDKPYPFLTHLLPTSVTIPLIENAAEEYLNRLLSFVPPVIIALESDTRSGEVEEEPSAESAIARLTEGQKRSLLKKVMRSPQFHQALGSLTMALRDGGLPSVAEALGIKVENGGYIPGGGMPLGGGEAVEAFVNGVKKTIKESKGG